MAVFGEGIVSAHIEMDVAFGGVDGIDDEVAITLFQVDTVFRSRSEDACAGDGHIRNLTSAGLDDGLIGRADGDAIDIALGFETDFTRCGKRAAGVHSPRRLQIDRALVRFRCQVAAHIRFDRMDGADGDSVAIDFKVAAFRCREGEEFLRSQVVQVSGRKIDLLSVFLVSDAARVLASLAAERNQLDVLSRNMRRFFQRRLGIGDTFLDAARAEGDEEILRRFRGADEDVRFLFFCEIGIARKALCLERCFPVNRGVLSIFDGLQVRLDAVLCPGADAAFQLVVARLLLRCILVTSLPSFMSVAFALSSKVYLPSLT